MNLQVISISASLGDSSAAAARKVTARPLPGQFLEQRLIADQRLSGVTDTSGDTTLSLIQGVSYEVNIQGWGSQVITVSPAVGTEEAPYAFTNYLAATPPDASGALPTANLITAQDGTIWQLMIVDNGDGTFSPSFKRVA